MLDRILAAKRRELRDLPTLNVGSLTANKRDFEAALRRDGLSIIAEVKRRSPSAGALQETVDPPSQAAAYAEGGARAISVLVDREFFGGSWEDLAAVTRRVNLPVLCKEFVLDVRQVHHARQAGAAACLLIVAALDDDRLRVLMREIDSLNMDALVEVHDEGELERAAACGAKIIGVNNRDLRTMEIDSDTTVRLAPLAPRGAVVVAESGYQTADALSDLPDRVDGVLIGTALMRSADPVAALREWTGSTGRGQGAAR